MINRSNNDDRYPNTNEESNANVGGDSNSHSTTTTRQSSNALHYQFLHPNSDTNIDSNNRPSLSASLTLGNDFDRLRLVSDIGSSNPSASTGNSFSNIGLSSELTSNESLEFTNHTNPTTSTSHVGHSSSTSNLIPTNNYENTNLNVNHDDDKNKITSIIHDAARVTDWTSVNMLAQSHPASAAYKCPDGLTPIHHACSRRCPNPSVFFNLIKANPHALTEIDEKGWTPLHYACRFKAPKEGVRLLLHLYKDKGCYAARLRCREKGRTPLYYAIRYDAPDGVVELLLNCMNRADILDGDRDGQSAIGLVWDQYVNSMEGKRIMMFYTKILKKWEEENVSWEERVEYARKLRENMKGKIKDCWEKANKLLRGAFKHSLDDNGNINNHVEIDCKDNHNGVDGNVDENERIEVLSKQRKWRVLHAAISTRCHSTLALMACVLHPEQIREIDDQDLFGAHPKIDQRVTDKFTALHLAAKSPMSGKDSRFVISELLEMYPEAASIPNPADNALPLHYLCENTAKVNWTKDVLPVYNAYPRAALERDKNGRTPLHCATTICETRYVPPAPFGTPSSSTVSSIRSFDSVTNLSVRSHASLDPAGSIIQNILKLHAEVASMRDTHGKLPLHCIAEFAEIWDLNVQCLYDAFPTALTTRTNAQSGNDLPLHLVAANPDAKLSLISKIVELNPRGASLVNRYGKLPLHLACESGKTFDGGLQCIYDAYPHAINIPEDNQRRWLPLHNIVTCPNSTVELIQKVMELNPGAATVLDGTNKTVLHLAIESGKDWYGGIETLFDANPDAIELEDNSGKIPLISAVLTYCDRKKYNIESIDPSLQNLDEANPSQDGQIAQTSEIENDELIGPHLAQINVLYHLLKAAPYVLKHS